jgi:hypothetical protein
MGALKTAITTWVERGIAFAQRFPFAVALFGFVSGLLSFVLVERKQGLVQIIVIMMLISWAWLLLEGLLKRSIAHWFGIKLPPALLSFAAQVVHQESLFFVIPFFFITTAWNTGQMVFTAFLILAAIISIIDPIYYRWLAPRRALYFIFHGITLFAVLLTALPILFHLPTPRTYLWALATAILLILPGVGYSLTLVWWKRSIALLLLAAIAGGLGLLVRPWIPPATLWLTQVALTDQIDRTQRAPVNSFRRVSLAQLRQGIYAYTAIHAPRGLNERIFHVWIHNGKVIDRVALQISGVREEGYRSWSHKQNFPANPLGSWQIQVQTEANQVIGRLRFYVVETSELTPITAPGAPESTIQSIPKPTPKPTAESDSD